MNVRDLTPGSRVVLILNTEQHAHDHPSPQPAEYLGLYRDGVVISTRGFEMDIPWDSTFYIAHPLTLTAYTRDDDEALPVTKAEAE